MKCCQAPCVVQVLGNAGSGTPGGEAECQGRQAEKRGSVSAQGKPCNSAEECDNGPQLFRLAVNPQSPILIEEKGCFDAPALKVLYAWREGEDNGALYRRYHPSAKKTSVHLVPYCLWGNRDLEGNAGEMTVWLRRREN